MAATELEKLIVQMDAKLTKFDNAMRKAQGIGNRAAGRIEQRFKAMNTQVAGQMAAMSKAFVSAFVGVGAVQSLGAIRDMVKGVADIGDAADKLGVSTTEYQKMAQVAALAGIETASLVNGMKRLAVNTSDAARGQGELGKLFDLNNVKITDGNGRLLSQTEILKRVADLVANAANEQDRAAIAMAAFGKSGVDLLNLLEGGAAGVTRAMEEVGRQGGAISEELVRKAQTFDDALDNTIYLVGVELKSAILELLPAADGTFGGILAWVRDLRKEVIFLKESFSAGWWEGLKSLNTALDPNNPLGAAESVTEARRAEAESLRAEIADLETQRAEIAKVYADTPVAMADANAMLDGVLNTRRQQLEEVLRLLGSTPNAAAAQAIGRDPLDIAPDRQTLDPNDLRPPKPSRPEKPTILPEAASGASSSVTRPPRDTASKGPNEYQRSVEQIRQNIAMLEAERGALLANAGSLDAMEAAAEKARIAQGLLNDAKAAGVEITPELRANIDQLAASYVSMQAQVDLARQKQEALAASMEEMKGLAKDVLGGFINDLRDGKSAMDALDGALDKIIDKLLDMAINGLVEAAFGALTGGGGGIGDIIGSLFGRSAGGMAKATTGRMVDVSRRSVTAARGSGGGARAITLVQHFHGIAGDAHIRQIAQKATRDGIREVERRRPQADLERRLRSE